MARDVVKESDRHQPHGGGGKRKAHKKQATVEQDLAQIYRMTNPAEDPRADDLRRLSRFTEDGGEPLSCEIS